MTRRTWLGISATILGACLAGGGLRADAGTAAGEAAHALIERMHAALMDGKADALRACFDPRMPGFKALADDVGLLLKESLAPSSVEFVSNTGDERKRELELAWRLEIHAYNGDASLERRARVKLTVEKQGADWRVVSFAPLDFLAPARNGAVWDQISDALGALTAVGDSAAGDRARVPARFLAAFDPRMPGYEQLRAGVGALLQQGNVESSVELVSSEGDDRRRGLELDWMLSIVSQDTGISRAQRHERVKCQVELQGKKWRIVALEPLEFLAPEKQPAAGAR